MTLTQILAELNTLADPEKVVKKREKYAIEATNSLGIYHSDLKEFAKKLPRDTDLAVRLFDSGIYEARLLCSKIFKPEHLTEVQMERWVKTFENWEICDSFCMGVFSKSKYAVPKAMEWSGRKSEFEKRAGFAIMAAYCIADKEAGNKVFEQFFPIIYRESIDGRLYVKKAVNWALRNIGKRNKDLNMMAISWAKKITMKDSKSAHWIGSNAIKELEKENVRISNYPRVIYGI